MAFSTVLQLFPHPSVCKLWAPWAEGMVSSLLYPRREYKTCWVTWASWSSMNPLSERVRRSKEKERQPWGWRVVSVLKETSPASWVQEQEQTQPLFLCCPRVLVSPLGYLTELKIKHLRNRTFCFTKRCFEQHLRLSHVLHNYCESCRIFYRLMYCDVCHCFYRPCCWTFRMLSISAVNLEAATVKSSTLLVNYLLL